MDTKLINRERNFWTGTFLEVVALIITSVVVFRGIIPALINMHDDFGFALAVLLGIIDAIVIVWMIIAIIVQISNHFNKD